MPVNLSPGALRDQRHAPQNCQQDREIENEQRIVVAIECGLILQNVFVGIYKKHVQADPPQQKNQEIERGQMEFLLSLARTRPHRRRSHHRYWLQKKWDVCPELLWRGPTYDDLVVQPCSKVGAHHRGTGGQQHPEPPCTSLVTHKRPQHI